MNISILSARCLLTAILTVGIFLSTTPAIAQTTSDADNHKPRLIVLSDIGNEPDDQMSMVRLMLYSNEIDIEGLIATTSTWLKDYPQPEYLRAVLDAYA